MADSVCSILGRLNAISDRVIRTPVSEEEVRVLENVVGITIPSCVKEYFRIVGLFQDLTAYGSSEYEVLDRFDRFREERQILANNFGPSAGNLFPFAGNGAGDIIAVSEEREGGMLFFANHETHEIIKIGTFLDWLSSVVEATLEQTRPANSEKCWCVQFSFRVSSPAPIVGALQQFGTARLGEWSEPKISPSNVQSAEAPLAFGKERLILKRSEYRSWDLPLFSIDYSEPATMAASGSMIRKLDAAFRSADLGYKLVDYGPLSLDWEKHESISHEQRTPWARIWNRLTRPS